MNNETVPAIELSDVSKFYQQGDTTVHAVDHVDLTLQRGAFATLAGPSGSGKTTLLNLIGGLDQPDTGTIRIDGETTTGLSDRELTRLRLHKIGFIFQAYNLIPVLTALENAEFVLLLQRRPADERQARVRALFAELGLEGLEHRLPTQLSGGQQQRVAVARAVAPEPAIVLADEPTANLDSQTSANLLEMMHRLNREQGVTFLFSTHDPAVIEQADRVIRMHDGRIVDDERR
ncbi:MAG: ABC transporter ATP-binding protein [Candidatus Dadabacteria bacterium]|nr:MAG: ABC transporter ATP-binding protein [Candidatus Dadabacteria bacterium]